MAGTKVVVLALAVCLLCLSSHPCLGERTFQERQRRGQQWQHQCDIQQLDAMEPTHQFRAEAGVVEIWKPNNEQFRCAGVAAVRYVIEPRGLLLPSYTSAPYLTYVVQGSGVQGVIKAGCPETFESGGRSESAGDQHQRLFRISQGDVIGSPAGVVQWTYNDGDTPIVSITLVDLSNAQNQLDLNFRSFYLAGKPQMGERAERGLNLREVSGDNIFRAFDDELLAEAFNVDIETVRGLKGENDERGCIVRVDRDLELEYPRWDEQAERRTTGFNGMEETICGLSFKHKIDEPSEIDVFTKHAGHIATVNGHKFPLLQFLKLSAERGVLYKNAMMTPHWNINAHSIMYVTRGSGHIQVAGEKGRLVFDGRVQQGQILVIPQNFVVVKKADEQEGLQWVSFKTNDNAMISPLAGRLSAIRAMPEDVLINSYGLSRDEVKRLKYGRQELSVFTPQMGRSI